MSGVEALVFLLLHLSSFCSARIIEQNPHSSTAIPPKAQSEALSPSISPELSPQNPKIAPVPSPRAHSPTVPGFVANPPNRKQRKKVPHAVSPSSFTPPQAGCDGILCLDPLTATPIGSPCGCVFPIKVTIDLGVAPYLLFMHIAQLEIEVASGTFLKQSQVKIMAAIPSVDDQQKTRVTLYLVPLREKFDNMTALLIYDRLWQKKVPITVSVFGDYELISVNYPGLPSSPPSMSEALGPTSRGGNKQRPLTADVPNSNNKNNNNSKNQKLNAWIIVVVSVSSCILLLFCFVFILFLIRWRKLRRAGGSVSPTITTAMTKRSGMRSTTLSTSIASSASVSVVSTVGPTCCSPSVKTFSLNELSQATENFSSKRILGEGGFGRVYRGVLENNSEVAVKLLTREDRSGDREFIAEVEMLSRLHHRNLVKLIGICIEGNKRCLVYELVRNGSVESHLHGVDKEKGLLNWETRMKIALGAARGLAYLHEDSNPRVIHRDFKASNILLEDDFTPKVTDFGLAREATEGIHHISTRVMGTFGYVAPEYAMTGHLLVKSDVYSYGVVLLELLSGRKPVYISDSQGPENLVTWARPLLTNREGIEKLIDSLLNNNYDFDNVAKVASIAAMCVHIEPSQRPFMGEVVQALKLVYNETDEACDDSYSQRESSSVADYDYTNEGGAWWNGSNFSNYSPYITMDYYSSGGMEEGLERERPRSVNSFGGGRVENLALSNRSGPLRSKKKKFAAFYRLRGSVSEHDHILKQPRGNRY